jgi:hypothetical protein
MTAIVSLLSLNSLADNTNSIEIHQVTGVTADNLDLNITQIGYNNKVNLSIAHDNNSLLFKQDGNNNKISWVDYWGSGSTHGGDLDGSGNNLHFEQECTRGAGNCSQSVIGFHINHPNNSVRWGQGRILTDIDDTTFTTDGDEGGGHRLNLDIHGEDNKLAGYQRNGSLNNYNGHTATIYFYSDDNEFFVKQETDGAKTLSLITYNDGNTGTVTQSGNGAHNATVTLNGTNPTTFNLSQTSNTAQTYTLSQNCQTVGGCSVSVTQN